MDDVPVTDSVRLCTRQTAPVIVAVLALWQLRPLRLPVGSIERFIAFQDEGWVKYLVSFELAEGPGGVLLTTETRGICTDPASRRRFSLYWAVIRHPIGLVRRDILRAVARAAEVGARRTPNRRFAAGGGLTARRVRLTR